MRRGCVASNPVMLSPAWAGVNTAGVRGEWEPVVTPIEHAQLVQLLTDESRCSYNLTGRGRGTFSPPHNPTSPAHCPTCRATARFMESDGHGAASSNCIAVFGAD